AMPHDEHGLQRIGLADLLLREQRGVEPASAGNPRPLHQRLAGKARPDPVVIHLPDATPMPPGIFGKPVIERQRGYIEAKIGGALNIGMTAENIGASAGSSDIAGSEQQDAARPNIGGPGRELSLPHRPDQRSRLLLSENF